MTDEEYCPEYQQWVLDLPEDEYRNMGKYDFGKSAWLEANRRDRDRIERLIYLVNRLSEEELSVGGVHLIQEARKDGLI